MTDSDPASVRRALHAYLDRQAHEAWHEFAVARGVSVSALVEVIGRDLGLLDDAPFDRRAAEHDNLHVFYERIALRGRLIDGEWRNQKSTFGDEGP